MREIGIDTQSPATRYAETAPRPRRPMPRQMRTRGPSYDDLQRAAAPRAPELYQAPRNQFAEAGQFALEQTGLPSVRRSARAFAEGDPRTGAGEAALGALALGGWAGGIRSAAPVRPPVRPAPRVPDEDAIDVFHGTDRGAEISRFFPFSHFGTRRAARDIGGREVIPARIAPGEVLDLAADTGIAHSPDMVVRGLLRSNRISADEADYVTEPLRVAREQVQPGYEPEFMGRNPNEVAQARMAEVLSRRGVSALRYTNQVEDAGSTSYIVPDPANVQRATRRRGLLGSRYEFDGPPPTSATAYGPTGFDAWRATNGPARSPPRLNQPKRNRPAPKAGFFNAGET